MSSAIHSHHIPVRDQGFCSSGVLDFPSLFSVVWKKVTTKATDRGARRGLELGVHEWYGTQEGIAVHYAQVQVQSQPPQLETKALYLSPHTAQ